MNKVGIVNSLNPWTVTIDILCGMHLAPVTLVDRNTWDYEFKFS